MHLQAIVTKFHGPTNSRGARVTARAGAGKLTTSWDYALNIHDNHAAAARALAEKLDWSGAWVSGGHPDGNGDVFVLVASNSAGLGKIEPAFVVGARS